MNTVELAAIHEVVGTGMGWAPGGFSRTRASNAVMGATVIDCALPPIDDRTM